VIIVAALPVRTRAAASLGSAVSGLSRRLGRGSGSVVGGRAILAVDPHALGRLAQGHVIGLVSGTNGKTTTTSLLRAALGAGGGPVASNVQGANLPPGLATALAAGPAGAPAALEVDEAWLGRVVEATAPRVAVLLNLSRDQLDRNNEVRRLAAGWRAVFSSGMAPAVVANADDPLVAWAAGGAAEVDWVAAGQPWTADASGCPNCGGRIIFPDGGGWECSSCDLRRPDVDVWIEASGGASIAYRNGSRYPLRLSLPGRCNQANAAMALTAARRMGADPRAAAGALAAVADVGGRYRTVTSGATRGRLLLAKNPAGWLEVFDLLAPPPAPVVVAINARVADGKDPSWLWDVPFERLAGRPVVATGERGRDLAVRLHYAEVEHRRVDDLIAAIDAAGPGDVDVVANYTTFQALNRALNR
jgi:UDP-N-acetylmuramyl tripeptide synthase